MIHPSAIVPEPENIGEGTKIWHFSHVRAGAKIGKACTIGQNVYVAPSVSIGDRSKVQNNVSLFDGVRLMEDVFIGPSVVFTNVKRPRAHIEQKASFLSTRIGKGVTIGANTTIICGVQIGEFAFIGAGALVTQSLPAYVMALGSPAKIVGYVCKCAYDLHPGQRCQQCALSYEDVTP